MPALKGKPAEGGAVATSIPGDSSAGAAEDGSRDVENPKIFGMTAKGLWDGRPSLGGVWVAHTSVKDPQRVVIRNEANGKSVVGALFRREIDNPGPPLQLSSDAAEALGMLAGEPATLKVTALERVEPAPAPEVPAKVAAEAKADAKGGQPGKVTTEVLTAGAASAIDKATAGKPDKAAGKPANGAPQPVMLPSALAPGAAPAAASATPPAPVPSAAQPTDALKRAYVQVGIFSVEANAQKAAAQMQKAGFKAKVQPDQSQGKSFWRVIIGPAASVAERDGMAAKVKALGYPDSYPVNR